MKVVTAAQMRRIDEVTIRERGVAGSVLMDRAGREVAREAIERFGPDAVAVVAGKGNNAGDGFVIARELAAAGVHVGLFLLRPAAELRGDARGAFDAMPAELRAAEPVTPGELERRLPEYDLIIDAMLGTGTRGPLAGEWAAAVAAINGSGLPVVAVDIPSGLPGEPPAPGEAWGPAVQATLTVTIGRPKLAMVVEPGVALTGRVVVVSIGFPPDLLNSEEITTELTTLEAARGLLPARPASGHKGTFGRVLVLGGSEGMSGAAVMAARAATRSGAGLVYVAYPAPLGPVIEGALLEPVKRPLGGERPWFGPEHVEAALAEAAQVDAVALGPGLGRREGTAEFLAAMLRGVRQPLVIDADGLNLLAERPDLLAERPGPTILTPHPGEAATLLGRTIGEVQADRLGAFVDFCARWNVVAVLKGAQTIITDAAGRRWINPSGNTGLAKGGSGDVLTGLVAGLAAQGMSATEAARLGVFLHGFTADLLAERMSVRALIAGDLLGALGEAWLRLERGGG